MDLRWQSSFVMEHHASNLTVLKILTGYGRTQFPVNEAADSLYDNFFLDVSFPNPEDPTGRPIFANALVIRLLQLYLLK